MNEELDDRLLDGIRHGEISSFEGLYNKYYAYLCLVSSRIVKEPLDAEEITSDVFLRLWSMRERIGEVFSIKAYLIRSVKNSSLNHIRNRAKSCTIVDKKFDELFVWSDDYPLGNLFGKEAEEMVKRGVDQLPESCRTIFLLSREDDKKYEEIADKLGISVNTVKTQMKIALEKLRHSLKEYL